MVCGGPVVSSLPEVFDLAPKMMLLEVCSRLTNYKAALISRMPRKSLRMSRRVLIQPNQQCLAMVVAEAAVVMAAPGEAHRVTEILD